MRARINTAARLRQVDLAVKKIKCDCGRFIEYTDRVVGGSNSQSGTLVCSKCSKEHAITFLGFLSEIKNATLKR